MSLYKTLLFIHIFSGFISLVSGVGASSVKQFNLKHVWHIRFGTAFFYGMMSIFITALLMSLLRDNTFLLLVAIFSFYFAFTGWRFAKNKDGVFNKIDWAAVIFLFVTGCIMIILGIYNAFNGANDMFVVLIVFGLIATANAFTDSKDLRSKDTKGKKRIALHASKMLAGLIATVTAFVVTNFKSDPEFLLWIAPGILIMPYIIYWNRKLLGNNK